jgi:type II secretory pathway pseudopilin PulG
VSYQRARVERRRANEIAAGCGRDREGGFTVIELVVVLGITTIAFTALAASLGTGMKALSVQKTRSQGNQLATQGIEDLQRYDFNDLGMCTGTADPAPAAVPPSLSGLSSVQLPNCGSSSLVYGQPCAPPGTALATFAVPRQTYTCVKNSVTYSVSRYVVWTDDAHTGKRLAVFVEWTDQVGRHQISQQSSLRSPNAASVIGVAPPQFVSVAVGAPNPAVIDSMGALQSTITFTASTTGLSASDRVYVTLNTLTTQPGGTVAALPTQYPLASGDGNNWSASLPGSSAPVFGAGSQYAVFTEVRTSSDGKANSKIALTTLRFCPTGGCPSGLPTISAATASPTAINIDSSGLLQSTFTITVSTANVPFESSVSATLQTQTGAASLQLRPSTACTAGGQCNTWQATFSSGGVNFRFMPGNQPFYITATAPVSGSANGSSAVATTNTVTFA